MLSLNGQEHELEKYKKAISPVRTTGIKYGFFSSIFAGFFLLVVFVEYGFAFWVGAELVQNNVYNINSGSDYNIKDIILIFFSVINGAFAFGSVGPTS